MKIRMILAALILATTLFTGQAHAAKDLQGRKTFGLEGVGHYTFTDYDSAYVSFPTNKIRVAGSGFHTYFEYGFDTHFAFEAAVGYERLHYAKQSNNPNIRQVISENFFTIDLRGNYYFLSGEKNVVQPYATTGVGTVISGKGAVPLLDVGAGAHFFVTDNVSIKLQALYKTAFIHHHFEGGLGVGFHF